MRRSLIARVVLLAAGLAAPVSIVAAVVARAGGERTRGAEPPMVKVAERDFHISAPKRARAGEIRLVVANGGPDTHELIVVRESPGRLPLRADGLTVDEEALERSTVATVDDIAPGSVRSALLELRPGRYELFCNMAGHYLGGMRHELVVR